MNSASSRCCPSGILQEGTGGSDIDGTTALIRRIWLSKPLRCRPDAKHRSSCRELDVNGDCGIMHTGTRLRVQTCNGTHTLRHGVHAGQENFTCNACFTPPNLLFAPWRWFVFPSERNRTKVRWPSTVVKPISVENESHDILHQAQSSEL